MTVNDVYKWLDSFAPFETQEEYDNAGLITGTPAAEIHKVLFALDATKAVITEAAGSGAELIVAHHPLMFSPIQQLRYDSGEGELLKLLASTGISLIAAHTNLDICPGGIADSLTEALCLRDTIPSESCAFMRTGMLQTACTAKDLLVAVSQALSAPVRMYGDPEKPVQSIAVAPGAGGSEYSHAQADVLITGEIKHHELLAAIASGLIVLDAGHYPTEYPGMEALQKRFRADAAANGWAVETSLFTQPPFQQTANEYPAPR